MTMTMTIPGIKRILIPLSARRPPAGLLEHAAEITARLQGELYGLFIEDSDLLNFARLPIGREIGISTGRVQSSSIADMERSLRYCARIWQQELARQATHYKIQSQFITRRGHTQQTLQVEMQPDDLLMLSAQGQQASRQSARQASDFLRKGHRYLAWLPPAFLPSTRIMAVQNDSPASADALALAQLLAKTNDHTVTILTLTDSDTLMEKIQACKQCLWILPYRQDWDVAVLETLFNKSPCPLVITNTPTTE